MIDQVYQPRLPEGMIRCYLVHGTVEGFAALGVPYMPHIFPEKKW